MASARNIQPIDSLIGMTIISRATGNKLGQVHDLVVDPVEGVLLGLSAQAPDGNIYGIEYGEIYNFGPDAVMVNADDSLSSLEGSPLVGPPLAKKNLAGAKIITESGKLLGSIANVFFHSSAPPFVVYEVRESLLDKLLGRAMFIPASAGRAMSEGAERIIVPDETPHQAADSLDAFAARRNTPADETTLVRDHGGVAPPVYFDEGAAEMMGSPAVSVTTRQAPAGGELFIGNDVGGGVEVTRETSDQTEGGAERFDSTLAKWAKRTGP